jgi:hypothetical protein
MSLGQLDKATNKAPTVIIMLALVHDKLTMLHTHKGLQGTQLGLDEDLTPAQQAHKQAVWATFKEAKRLANGSTCVGPISTSTTKS